ncbi:MAG: alpha/beta fold hydrolase [Pseudonocardia sp.]
MSERQPARTERRVRTSDGVELHVAIRGDGPVTVVLAHGWTLDTRVWEPVAARLAGSARVVTYDHRGHGRSGAAPVGTMTLERLADDLAAVITEVAPEGSVVLGGHSMGGMTAMALAERHPHVVPRVRGLALVSTASGGLAGHTLGLRPGAAAVVRVVERRLYAARGWARRPRIAGPRALAPALRWLLLGRDADATARRLTYAAVASCRPATVSGFRPALDAHERDAALAAFADVPAVVLVGSRDRLTPVSSARRIVAALPSAGLTIYPGAGHMLPVERVAAVAAHLSALVGGASTVADAGG